MKPRTVSFDLVFLNAFRKRYVCWLSTRGKRFMIFEQWFRVKNLKAITILKRQPKLCQETHFWTNFQKTFLEWILRRFTGFLRGGGGGKTCLCVSITKKSLLWIGLSINTPPDHAGLLVYSGSKKRRLMQDGFPSLLDIWLDKGLRKPDQVVVDEST